MKPTLIAMILTATALTAVAESPKEKGLNSINRATAEAHIGFLAADELLGREAGYPGGRIARNYIEAYVKSLGLEPWNGDSYRQPFSAYHKERQKRGRWQVHPDSIAELENQVHQKIDLNNIIVKIDGKKADEYVILGTHFDHIGFDPLLDGDQIYNGADDNASGVAAGLQIARAFIESGVQPERTVIFAFWDGEEKGLLGSEYFMQNWAKPEQIKGYLNFDMIGRNNNESNPEHVVYFYTEAHPAFGDWLKNDITTYNLNLKPNYRPWDRPIGGSDNSSFAKREIPIIWYHTDGHPDYHMPGDHADRINYEKTVDITKAAYLNLWNLANEKEY